MYNAILVLFYAIVYAYCFRYERARKQMRAISPYDKLPLFVGERPGAHQRPSTAR